MPTNIEWVRYYACGYCTHNIKGLFKGFPSEHRPFQAGVFLIKHKEKGYILYDTGYSTDLYKKGIKKSFYRKLTPLFVEQSDELANQLKQDGIDPLEIQWVILSHFHPDHIGGARAFSSATFLVTKEAYATYRSPKINDLVFNDLLPDDFSERVRILHMGENPSFYEGYATLDLFGDESLLLLSVGGHAAGQCCAYLPEKELFIGADLCWGIALLPYTEKMKKIAKMVQDDFNEYKRGVQLLRTLSKKGIEVVVSHDPKERVEEILG